LSVTLDTQIKTLKELIWEKVGILPRRQQLAFGASPLKDDECTIGESDIKDGTNLTLVKHREEECYADGVWFYVSERGMEALMCKLAQGKEIQAADLLHKLTLFMRMPDDELLVPVNMSLRTEVYTHVSEMIDDAGWKDTAFFLVEGYRLAQNADVEPRPFAMTAKQLQCMYWKRLEDGEDDGVYGEDGGAIRASTVVDAGLHMVAINSMWVRGG